MEQTFRILTLVVNVIQLVVLCFMISLYIPETGIQLIEKQPWITLQLGDWGILKAEYFVGIDGLSLPLVALSVFVMLIATVSSWTLGSGLGANTLTAALPALPSVTFTATATVGAPAQLVKTAGDGQTATVNFNVTTAPSVTVRDAGGNPVSGVAVTFRVTAVNNSDPEVAFRAEELLEELQAAGQ